MKKQNVIGSIETNKNADIIILNDEITNKTDADQLRVNHTIINGESKYTREIS